MVCASELRSEILDLSHSQWCSGHFGIFKTHKRVLASFWWGGLYFDIVDLITQCEVCISVKALDRNPGRLGIRSFPSVPMELVSIDFLVDLPITHRGNRHVLSINHQFSKFTQLSAVPDRTAATSAKCVFDYFLKFGIAKKFYSDCDPAFESELFQLLMKIFGVKKLRTTGYNPRANGLAEKGNEFIKNYLASYLNYSDKRWDLRCREASYAYNSSVHSSTGFTPAKLTFGHHCRLPIDIMYNVCNDDRKYSSITGYGRTLQDLYNAAKVSFLEKKLGTRLFFLADMRFS